MRFRRLAGLTAVLMLALAACGGTGGSGATTPAAEREPQTDADVAGTIAVGLTEGFGVNERLTDCVADELVESGFSDEALEAMTDATQDVSGGDAQSFSDAVRAGIVACSGELPSEISASLLKEFGFPMTTAECVAARLVTGEFSEEALQAMADESREMPAAEADAFVAAVRSGAIVCTESPTARIAGSLARSFGLASGLADCIAERLIAADLSDEALRAIADDTLELPAGEAEQVAEELRESAAACA